MDNIWILRKERRRDAARYLYQKDETAQAIILRRWWDRLITRVWMHSSTGEGQIEESNILLDQGY